MAPAWILLTALAWAAPSPTPAPVPIATRIKPEVWKRVVSDREIMTSASLDEVKAPLKRYSFYAAMLARAGVDKTRRILTDYRLYVKMVPYVDKAEFDDKTRILRIEGGILGFRLASLVRFEERGDRWIRYRIVGGHFVGMEGDIVFESLGEKGTVVYFGGEQLGRKWPPAFVIERGAEIVFGFTAKKMRSYIESPESDAPAPKASELPPKEKTDDRKKESEPVPEPRRRLSGLP
jgi:hypothetical protein